MLLYGRRHPWKVATYLGGKRSNRNYLIGTMIKMFAGLSCIGSPSSRTDTPPKGNPGFCSSSWGHTQLFTSKCTFRHPLPAASYRFDRAYSKPPCCIHLCKQIWPEKRNEQRLIERNWPLKITPLLDPAAYQLRMYASRQSLSWRSWKVYSPQCCLLLTPWMHISQWAAALLCEPPSPVSAPLQM